jgi:hypothetical protein
MKISIVRKESSAEAVFTASKSFSLPPWHGSSNSLSAFADFAILTSRKRNYPVIKRAAHGTFSELTTPG